MGNKQTGTKRKREEDAPKQFEINPQPLLVPQTLTVTKKEEEYQDSMEDEDVDESINPVRLPNTHEIKWSRTDIKSLIE